MAVDDARHIRKLILMLSDGKNLAANELQQVLTDGEMLHLFRLLCSHLYEAGIAFRKMSHNTLAVYIAHIPGAQEKLDYVGSCFSPDSKDALHLAFLKPIRDTIGFHYKDGPLKEALLALHSQPDSEGKLLVSPALGLGRYNIADEIAYTYIGGLLGVDRDNFLAVFDEKIGETLKLAAYLSEIVDLLMSHAISLNSQGTTSELAGHLFVPPAISRAYRQHRKMKGRS